MANISDFAINLSDLTNSVSVLSLEPEDITPSILYSAIDQVSQKYDSKTFPVLIHPLSYAKTQSIKYKRVYHLWTLNMAYTDDYFKNFNLLV